MLLRWLISAVGFAAARGEAQAFARRAGRRALLATMILVCWCVAFGFALAALAVWLSAELGAGVAYAVIAAGLALLGLTVQLGLALSARRHRRGIPWPLPGVAGRPGKTAGPDGSTLGALAIVALAGYLLSRQFFRK